MGKQSIGGEVHAWLCSSVEWQCVAGKSIKIKKSNLKKS